MGKVEKIVVLSVLFLIVLILSISLNTTPGGSTGLPETPHDRAMAKLDPAEPASQGPAEEQIPADIQAALLDLDGPSTSEQGPLELDPPTPAYRPEPETSGGNTLEANFQDPRRLERAPSEGTPGILSSGVREASATPEPDPRLEALPIGEDWDLQTTVGMSRTAVPFFLVYTCRAGDTFEGLAQSFYGDASRAQLLRLNNEGQDTLGEGTELLVPVRDDSSEVHQVAENESLWAIASNHYGDGTRWPEIFEANRHLLSAPKDLRPGMELTIP